MTSKICETQWEIGSHMIFKGSLESLCNESIRFGMYTTQFFLGDAKNAWRRFLVSDEDLKKAKIKIEKFHLNIFSHYPFCANLAGKATKDGLAWEDNKEVDRKLYGVISALEYELDTISKLKTENNKTGVVIHPGSNVNRELGHKKVAETINKINFSNPDQQLLLENCAGEGNKLCKNLFEISKVLEMVDKSKQANVKVCIDTAHLWGEGDYNLSQIDEIDRFFSDFDRLIGLDRWYLLHLNDSGVPVGSKKDIHACLGEGYIWKKSFDSLHHLLNRCKEYQIPIVLETEITDLLTVGKIWK